MKKLFENPILMFIIGVIISGGITGVLAYKLAANQVSFTPSDSTWQVSDVDNALDSLFDMATYGNASASDIVSGKTALVNGEQVTGNLTVPSYQTLANTENVSAGSSSSARTGYYYLNNYKVTCGTTTCPSYTSLSGTQNVGAGSSSTTLNGYYNMSNYKVSCASCPACNSCCSSSSSLVNLLSNVVINDTSSHSYTLTGSIANYNYLIFAVVNVSDTSVSSSKIIGTTPTTGIGIIQRSSFVNSTAVIPYTNGSSGSAAYQKATFTYSSNNSLSIKMSSATKRTIYIYGI